MPDHKLTLTDDDVVLLERVRVRYGLETIDQAAELLAKQALRRTARQSNGRGRALYAVPSKQGGVK
jgi:hypothetical protein